MGMEIRGLREAELEAHAELVYVSYYDRTQGRPGSFLADPQWWLKFAQADPYYQPEQTRVMALNGQLVASVTNYTRQMNVAGRLAKASCIGSVCTHPDFRKRGLLRQVLAEAIDWMGHEGYNWSLLYGKEEVYGGSGWTILTSLNLATSLHLRDECGRGLTRRTVDPEQDIATLANIYEQYNSRLTGPIVRTEDYWRNRTLAVPTTQGGPAYYLLEHDGTAVGYYSGNADTITEIGWTSYPEEVLAAVLRHSPAEQVSFNCCTLEMVRCLREISYVPNYATSQEHPSGMKLTETYKGLWRYIGDSQGLFPEICSTESLKRFMRSHEYIFWPADHF